jgi:hypothetical protein
MTTTTIGYTCGVAKDDSLISSVWESGGVAVGVDTSSCRENSLETLISGACSSWGDWGGVARGVEMVGVAVTDDTTLPDSGGV